MLWESHFVVSCSYVSCQAALISLSINKSALLVFAHGQVHASIERLCCVCLFIYLLFVVSFPTALLKVHRCLLVHASQVFLFCRSFRRTFRLHWTIKNHAKPACSEAKLLGCFKNPWHSIQCRYFKFMVQMSPS